MNDVADIEQANSGDPLKRRHQFRIAKLGFGVFDRRLIRFDNGLFLSDLCFLRGDLLLRCEALLCQRDVSAEIDLPIFEMGLIAGEIGLRLVELRLIGTRVKLRQELAFFDVLAILEVDAKDLLRNQAAHRRRVQRRHVANPRQHDGKALLLDGGRDDRNSGRRLWRRSRGAVREMLPAQIGSRDNRDGHETDKHRGMSSMLRGGSFGCGG